MPAVNLTVEQLVEALSQLRPEELKRVKKELRQRLASESETEAHHALVAAAVEATDWWDGEGDKEWDKWQP
jgi:hypothetical protein